MNINTRSTTPGQLLSVLKEFYMMRQPVMIWGMPGIGKSDVIKTFSKAEGFKLFDIRLTTIESTDLRGQPFVDIKNKKSIFLDSDMLPFEEDGKSIVFLDELSAAEPRLQASCYQLVWDHQIGTRKLGSDVWVIAAGNRPEDGAISYEMGTALADRFIHILVEPNHEEWIQYAFDSSHHPAILAFLKQEPRYLTCTELEVSGAKVSSHDSTLITPSPRSWTRASKILYATSNPLARELALSGLLGRAIYEKLIITLAEVNDFPGTEILYSNKENFKDAIMKCKKIPIAALYSTTYSQSYFIKDFPTSKHAAKVGCMNVKEAAGLLERTAEIWEVISEWASKNNKQSTVPWAELQTLAMSNCTEAISNIMSNSETNTTSDKTWIVKCRQVWDRNGEEGSSVNRWRLRAKKYNKISKDSKILNTSMPDSKFTIQKILQYEEEADVKA